MYWDRLPRLRFHVERSRAFLRRFRASVVLRAEILDMALELGVWRPGMQEYLKWT